MEKWFKLAFDDESVVECTEDHLFMVHTNDKNIKIPEFFKDIPVFKQHSDSFHAKTDVNPKLKITSKGDRAINTAPIIGGYIPENMYVLLLLRSGHINDLNGLKKSKRKLTDAQGLVKYLQQRGLITVNK